jgi:hypothetical protein
MHRKKQLRGATLTVAVLIFLFLVLLLTTLLRWVLAGLSGLLTLSVLSGLATLLALPGLVTLPFFFHIVCHRSFLLKKRGPSQRFWNVSKSKP